LAKALIVWETTTGKRRHRIEPPADDAYFSWDASLPDGQTLVTCDLKSGAVRLWNLERGTNRLLRRTAQGVRRLVFAPDGKRIFTQSHASIQCWNVADGKVLWESLRGGPTLEIAPDGRALLVVEMRGGSKHCQLLDSVTGKPHPKLRLPQRVSGWPEWGADGRTLLIPDQDEKIIHIWDLETGKDRCRLPWAYWPLVMYPDGNSILVEDRGLQRWDLRTGKPLYPSISNRGHTQAVADLACSPDSKFLVSVDQERSIHFWDLRTSRLIRIVRDLACVSLAFTPDGGRLIVATGEGDTLLICDPTTGKAFDRRKFENLSEDFAGRHRMLLCEAGRLVLNRHNSVRAWSHGPGGVTAAWDLKTGKRLWRRSVEGAAGLSGLSQDGSLGVAWDMTLREVESGQVLGRLTEKDGLEQVANQRTEFSPDDSLIATHAYRLGDPNSGWKDSGIEIWERATRRLLRRLPLSGWSFAFASDGRQLAVLGGHELWVWDVPRGKELFHRKAMGDTTNWYGTQLVFVPSGRALVMATEDGSILKWELPAPPPRVNDDAKARRAWKALGDPDPARGFAAAADLADCPGNGVAIIKEHIGTEIKTPTEQVRRLITALDDDAFRSREASQRKLAALVSRVRPMLREALDRHPSAEARRRLERLLDEKLPPSAEALRLHRALRALEWAGTTDARDFLGLLATGDPAAPLTQEAQAALHRLARRPP
jgi:WD40 repeat protein